MSSRKRAKKARPSGGAPAAVRKTNEEAVAAAALRSDRWTRLVGVVLVAVTVAVFGAALSNGFVSYDDELYVLKNPHVRTGLTLSGVAWAFTATEAANWHPLTWISHMADVSLFGLAPAGHHATSVLLHAANVLLVFLLLRRGTGRLAESAAAAALFALHPLRVESVAWVAERKDVLSLFFGLLAIAAWGRWTKSRRPAHYGWSVALCAASLMAKATFVMLPVLLLALDFWPLERVRTEPRRRLFLEKVPYAALALVAAILVWNAQRAGGATAALDLSPGVRVENALVSVVRYLGKTFWPADLAVLYPHPASGFGWRTVAAAVVIAAITALAVRQRDRRPYLLAGWVWYLAALLPVIGLVQLGWHSVADRYTLVPSLGIVAAFVWGISDLASARVPGRVLAGAGLAAAAVLAVLTVRQIRTWRDSLSLYEHAVAVTGPNETMEIDLGNELARRGRTEEASRHFAEALKIAPGSKDALYALGSVALGDGRLPEARARFAEAVRLHPDFVEARVRMASAFVRENKPADAIAEARRALETRPNDPDALYVWGAALDAQGNDRGAEEKYRAALAARPGYAEAHQNLGELLAARGKTAEAAAEFQAALAANPDFAEARQALEALKQRRPSS